MARASGGIVSFFGDATTNGFPCVESAIDRDGIRWTCVAGHSPLCPKRYERLFAEARWIVVNSEASGFGKLSPDLEEYSCRRRAFLEEPYVATAIAPETQS